MRRLTFVIDGVPDDQVMTVSGWMAAGMMSVPSTTLSEFIDEPHDEFGVEDTEFEDGISNRQLARQLMDYACPAGLPHTGDDPYSDHGHTMCMWLGMAAKRLMERT